MKNRLQLRISRGLLCALALILGLSQSFLAESSSATSFAAVANNTAVLGKAAPAKNEVRAVWISYFELEPLLKNKTESAFRSDVFKLFAGLSKDQMNTVMIQVRPFGDAIYKSEMFPTSYMMTGTEGDQLQFDPLAVMIEEAKKNNLKVEAWINPYRVRINTIKVPISADNMANQWLADGSNRVVKLSSGTFYNPSDPEVSKMVVDSVKEILDQYAVDGIHFDDYFYPATTSSFDKPQYDAYLQSGGKLKLADFRRKQINEMVAAVYKACKSNGKSVRFGISPQGLIQNNYDAQYADVKKWVTQTGYIDYICPQIYYGFKNSKAPFQKILNEWSSLTKNSKVAVYIGLAPYKIGVEDKWSGSGKKEWQQDQQILSRMIQASRKTNQYAGFVLFRYDSLWKPAAAVKKQVDLERIAMIKLLTQLSK